MDQNPADRPQRERPLREERPAAEARPPGEERRSPGPGSRRPSPKVVALVLIGIVIVLSVGAYALVTAWLG